MYLNKKYLFVLIWVLGCSQRQTATFFNENNHKVIYEYIVEDEDTIFDGSYKEYYTNGNVDYIENYNKGILNGEAKYYWPNGKPRMLFSYSDNRLHEQKYIWDTTGVIIDSFSIKNGKGEYHAYNKKKVLTQKYNVDSGYYNGECFDYNENGKLIGTYYYVDGQKHGPAVILKDNNKYYLTYKYDKIDGQVLGFDSVGHPISKAKLKNGIYIDTCWFFKNNLIELMFIYKSDLFTSEDSVTLRLKKGSGISALFLPYFSRNDGIIIKTIEYDKYGKPGKVTNYENNLPTDK